MMFKGTDQFGTADYAAEKPLLDSIESLFNSYAEITDPAERTAHYQKIDEISNEAAKYAIANEYDKLIAGIGGRGSNAYTANDQTVYVVDIPNNQMDKLLAIEGNRFGKIVNRLFHTELEAVYEEKNGSLSNDNWKVSEVLNALLFEKHQYGTQTVIGTIQHLKNPSITEIRKYFDKYYRPNNVAICISGDVDPTTTIKQIEKYFGAWESNPNLGNYQRIEEAPITAPRTAEVMGVDAEFLSMGYRFEGAGSEEALMLQLVDGLLSNSTAGLIDLNIVQQQKAIDAGCYSDIMSDYSVHNFYGVPVEGQSLEEVQQLILDQIELLKSGSFDDWLIGAVVAEMKKSNMRSLESNNSRAGAMVNAFINDVSWADQSSKLDRLSKITKEEVMAFVKEHYTTNYVAVYKREGEDPNEQQIEKPQITKVPLNRAGQSDFHKAILAKESPAVTPRFLDYEKDIARGEMNGGVKILSKKNEENGLFSLTYVLEVGRNNDPVISTAIDYLEFLGTKEFDAEALKKEFYKLGSSMRLSAANERTYVTLSGLDENMDQSIALFESLLSDPQPNEAALTSLIDNLMKSRTDNKKNKDAIFSGLVNYARYGAKSPFTNVLSNSELRGLQSADLIAKIKNITQMEHRVLYYGPRELASVETLLNTHHKVPAELKPVPAPVKYERVSTAEPKVFWAEYDMVQAEFMTMHLGSTYDQSLTPAVRAFNEYFGSSIVFQEIREAQGLAYTAYANYGVPSRVDRHHEFQTYVGTQADKQSEAMKAMIDLVNNMPQTESSFEVAKASILSKIESERITKSSVIWNYIGAQDLGLNEDPRKLVYEQVKAMTMQDLMNFHAAHVKDKSYITIILGDPDKLDLKDLENYGSVTKLSLDELFGYSDENATAAN